MCDNLHSHANSYDGFFHHYLTEHAALMTHFQQMHSSGGNNNYYSNLNNSAYSHCVTGQNSCSSSCSLSNCTSCDSSSSSCDSSCSCCSSSSTFSEFETEELRFEDNEKEYIDTDELGNGVYELEQEYDEDESECEYELNVDALLAFRAATKELKEAEESELKKSSSSSDSLVYIDSDKEDFEFVELGSLNTLQSTACRGVGSRRDRNLEAKTQKEIMKHCYGDHSSKISGQETAMSIDFERLCDSYQPSLWPVLPLRLKFN